MKGEFNGSIYRRNKRSKTNRRSTKKKIAAHGRLVFILPRLFEVLVSDVVVELRGRDLRKIGQAEVAAKIPALVSGVAI